MSLKSDDPETLRSPLVLRPPPAKTSPDEDINDGAFIAPETFTSPLVLILAPKTSPELEINEPLLYCSADSSVTRSS